MMRMEYILDGREHSFVLSGSPVTIGRPDANGVPPDLDLTPDLSVSRRHARLWQEDNDWWIEDTGSTHGTLLNGKRLEGRARLAPGDLIQVGKTELRVVAGAGEADTLPPQDTDQPAGGPTPPDPLMDAAPDQRLAVLYGLLGETGADALLKQIVQQVAAVVPAARRSAILLGQGLELRAHFPDDFRPSTTLAAGALQARQPVTWPLPTDNPSAERPGTPASLTVVESAIYVPLLWQEEALGVLCVDNCGDSPAFTEEDTRLLQALASHAATVVQNQRLQREVKRYLAIKANLERQFSPKVAERLMSQRGRLRMGGERSEVTILCTDIRGFSRIAGQMEPDAVVEMINEYFERMVPVVFDYGGTVDKYVGDAILAVFGSPEPDPQQHEHAVRAALAMQAAIAEVSEARSARREVACQMGIGLHCGEVLHGFIGSSQRMEFTVIGDAVNYASRHCDNAPGGQVLISEELHARVWRQFETDLTHITPKHETPRPAYRVIQAKS